MYELLRRSGLYARGVAGGEDSEHRHKKLSQKESVRDPSNLWDNRSSKRGPGQPDFKHVTQEPLWMDSHDNPSWVSKELLRGGLAAAELHTGMVNNASVALEDTLSPSIIWACCKNKDLERGTQIHKELQKRGLVDKNYSDALVTMYAKCGELQKAQELLDIHKSSYIIPWNALIAGYAREGKGHKALDCLKQMQCMGNLPNEVTYVCILKACAMIGDIDKGKKIHDEISSQGLLEHHNIVLGAALVGMYAKCGALLQARSVLEKLPSRNVVCWNALIAGYAQNGQGQRALDCFEHMQCEGIHPNEVSYACILKACAAIGAIDKGKKVHDEILRQGLLECNIVLGSALVDMYAKCGALCQAQSVLEKLNSRDVVCWNALIAGYVQDGQGHKALDCLEQMHHEGILANEVTYACILGACASIGDIGKGERVHNEILRQGLLEHHKVLGGALVDMYAKCGALCKAQTVLEKLSSRDVVSWGALIAGYTQGGQVQKALDCFEQMQREGILPDKVTYVCILNACAVIGDIDKGKKVHDEISRKRLLDDDVMLGGALVGMYAKCGSLLQARSVLEKLPFRNVVCWNALIAGYAQNGQGQQALDCFEQMQHEGIHSNEVTYVCILKACAAIGAIDKGKKVHNEISRQGLWTHNIVLGSALVDMYAKCGALCQAQSVLEKLHSRDIVCWNALITGYAQDGQGQQALDCFEQMKCEGIHPDEVTYVCILKACATIGAIDKGRKVHDEIFRRGLLEHDSVLGGALVDMYAKCGAVRQAQSILEKLSSRDIVCWNALIAGYARIGQGQQALDCFEQMQREGIFPDEVTYGCILNACATIGAIDKGRKVHDEILRHRFLEHHIVLDGALVDMYAKSGALCEAQAVLEKLPSRNVVCWNALIAGYAQIGQGQQALDCFKRMKWEGIHPDEVTYACILKACASIGAIDKGQKVHDEILRQRLLEHDIVLGGALVDMYAKCGAVGHARSVLEKLSSRDIVCWNALIAGYAQIGQGQQALDCFEQMQREGIFPDEVTFCCVLNVCSHLGLVDKGQGLFDSMEFMYGLKPGLETFTCMVDLFGRAGHLVKAVEVIQGMPFSANSAIWHCLLGACRKWVDVNVGTWAFEQAVELDKCTGQLTF